MGGTTVHLCAGLLHVAESGEMVVGERKAIPEGPFLLTVTRQGDELSVAVDGEVWLRQTLKHPFKGEHKFSIGGFVSRLSLGGVTVLPADAPPVAKADPPKADPPKPADAPPGVGDGPAWTMDLDKMKIPDAPASGNILGVPLLVNETSLNKLTGWLMLRQGNGHGPGASVLIMGPGKSLQEIEGKTYEVPAVRPSGAAWYFVHLALTRRGTSKSPYERSSATAMPCDWDSGKVPGRQADGQDLHVFFRRGQERHCGVLRAGRQVNARSREQRPRPR